MANYKEIKERWVKIGRKGRYGYAISSFEHERATLEIIENVKEYVGKCSNLCELGFGNGRNIKLFHDAFPKWLYSGNDININTVNLVKDVYPSVLNFCNIAVVDTLSYLQNKGMADITFTHGHLMHLPYDVINRVCKLISNKTNKFIIIMEAYPCEKSKEQAGRYELYRFERDYETMFEGFILRGKINKGREEEREEDLFIYI